MSAAGNEAQPGMAGGCQPLTFTVASSRGEREASQTHGRCVLWGT